MTAGFLRPVVLLPDSCAERLDDGELEAVLAHEVAHVERRHNLAALVQNVATVLFWFHPALWMATRRLHQEAEKDCDQRVLTFVPDPPTYVSGMLKVSQGFIAPRPAGVSCMSASLLKERMDTLMTQASNHRTLPHRLALAAGFLALALTTLFVSAGSAPSSPSTAPTMASEEGITEPKLVSSVSPVYPPSAREKRVQGMVIVQTSIDARGRVTAASVAQGVQGEEGKALEEAALTAVKQWKFEPATKNGKPVSTSYKVTINFKLE